MSFTVKSEIPGRLKYPSIGVELRDELLNVLVTYSVQAISVDAVSREVVAVFKASVEECLYDGVVEFRFICDEGSDVIAEAENKFKNSLI
ncbi:MAG: hypothetical protein [Bacteriophage sp.]|nr:MAG: hypothetical protein [Bacteriophage sp.]